ncbi:MAG: hypothetical protein IT294_05150 [Deltaproteobacteria bacterium]|nr:hypothetical protein [Deltaproteobacteria bacterium]
MKANDAPLSQRHIAATVFLLALAIVILEISYTRVFSFKFHYYFSYLIIGVALLGLGTGGVLVTMSARLRAARAANLSALCLGASVAVGIGYLVMALAPVSAFQATALIGEGVKLLGLIGILFLPFLLAGMVLAVLFSRHADDISRLYGIDLLGAALGCITGALLIGPLTPPGCVMASSLLMLMAAWNCANANTRPSWKGRLPMFMLAAALLLAIATPSILPDPRVDDSKTLATDALGPRVFSRWNPVFRIDVTHKPGPHGVDYWIHHDGHLGTALHAFDGTFEHVTSLKNDPRSLPFAVLNRKPSVLVIGAAGGHELLASLYFGAARVTGIELNPVTISLLTDYFADFTGHIASDPRVTLINDEGRSFLRRSTAAYDLIWLVAPDSYAAMNAATAGAFVLSESYLYTVEMVADAIDHLATDGILCAQFGELEYEQHPNRTARYVATARAALEARHVQDVANHVLVATQAGSDMYTSTVLVKATPFTREERARFVTTTEALPDSIVRHDGATPSSDRGPLGHVLNDDAYTLRAWQKTHPYELTAVYDDSPFFWHFVRFRDAFRPARARGLPVHAESFIGERVLVVLLGLATSFASVWMLLPFVGSVPSWKSVPHKRMTTLYFACIGIGFMFYEVTLMQMLTLLLGYPTYSLSVTLFALLVFAGFGSLMTGRWRGHGSAAVTVALGALAIATLIYTFLLPDIVAQFGGMSLPFRLALAIGIIAPMGFCLGTFMPYGLGLVARVGSQELVAWGWAVNGFFSVAGSMLSTILAMTFGFRAILVFALGLYAFAVLTLRFGTRGVPG